MDGVHDLGGKQGFGPIETDESEIPFHHEWEAREWGISRSVGAPGITIDWWRHCRELIAPEDYLGRPYFDSWAQTDFATFINAGVISIEEVKSTKSISDQNQNVPQPPVLTYDEALRADVDSAQRFDMEIDTQPAFAVAQQIITCKNGDSGHTRLPQYARGRVGVVHEYNGAHVFPDLSAQGEKVAQHLYTVMFEGRDLWPENNQQNNKVYLDLWERYLLPS